MPKRSVVRGGEQRVRERRGNSCGVERGKQRERLTVPDASA